MRSFMMNGILWHFVLVWPYANVLMDRTGQKRVATTDPDTRCIYISSNLDPDLRKRVILHELVHAAMISYGLIPQVRDFTYPEAEIRAEEWICNFLADYGSEIFAIAASLYSFWR